MERIKQSFAKAKQQNRAALGAYVTAGYPTVDETPRILLSLESSGADMIELGMPFTDPIADGPVVQKTNTAALANGVNLSVVLELVRDARSRGLRIPVLLMGHYNPILRYGEEEFVRECKRTGVNGFVVVDLPIEESAQFRKLCASNGLSFIPLIAPSTPVSGLREPGERLSAIIRSPTADPNTIFIFERAPIFSRDSPFVHNRDKIQSREVFASTGPKIPLQSR